LHTGQTFQISRYCAGSNGEAEQRPPDSKSVHCSRARLMMANDDDDITHECYSYMCCMLLYYIHLLTEKSYLVLWCGIIFQLLQLFWQHFTVAVSPSPSSITSSSCLAVAFNVSVLFLLLDNTLALAMAGWLCGKNVFL